MSESPLCSLIEKWSNIGLESGWVENWVEGAIFPREMVFFVARCEELGIRSIIESGRQDGYSTEILGQYSNEMDANVFSIDWEEDAERAARCRKKLSIYPKIQCIKGDATMWLGRLTQSEKGRPTAILCDGPKHFLAMSLMFSCATFPTVRLLGLHNLINEKREYFSSCTSEPTFYEGFDFRSGGAWEVLTRREVEHAQRLNANRSLEDSSLGVMSVTSDVRKRLYYAEHPEFGMAPPKRVYLGWKLGLYGPTSLLYSLPNKIDRVRNRLLGNHRRAA